jgi:hypothetical protein
MFMAVMGSGWWIVAALPAAVVVALVAVLWHRHRRTNNQPAYPPFEPTTPGALRWEDMRRHERDNHATTRFPVLPAKPDPKARP